MGFHSLARRLYPLQPVVGVGAIIISDGRILLEKRRSEPGRGKWSVPGGLVELGESPENAVIREVKEETGLEVYDPKLIDVVNSVVFDEAGKVKYHFIIINYFLKLKGGDLGAYDDAEAVQWVSLSDVEKFDITETFRGFIKRNLEKLKHLDSCR